MALKYRNKPTIIDGIRFDSRAEAKRYGELKLLQRAGQIRDLQCQPKFPLTVNEKLIATYVGDFFYYERGKPVWEEVKGFETKEWKLKRKLFEALNTSELRILYANGKPSRKRRASPRTASARKRSADSNGTSK